MSAKTKRLRLKERVNDIKMITFNGYHKCSFHISLNSIEL